MELIYRADYYPTIDISINKNDLGMCVFCNKKETNLKNGMVHLECGHSIHKECLGTVVFNTCSKMDVSIIFKHEILDIKETIENSVYLANGKDECVIKCPKCEKRYSILSAIYRKFGIPKSFNYVVVFEKDGKKLYHYISSKIDLCHYLKIEKQREIFKNFDYKSESTIDFSKDYEIIDWLIDKDHEYHAIVINDAPNKEVFFIMPANECHACLIPDGMEPDLYKNIVRHACISDWLKFQEK